MKNIKNAVAIFISIILTLFFAIYMYLFPEPFYSTAKHPISEVNSGTIGKINHEMGVKQIFYIDSTAELSSINIQLATYGRQNNSHYNIIIKLNENEVYQEKIYAMDLEDNAFYPIEHLDLSVNPGDELHISIMADGEIEKGNEITAWVKDVSDSSGALYRVTDEGNIPAAGELSIIITHDSPITTYLATRYLNGNTVIPAAGGIILLLLIGLLFYLLLAPEEDKNKYNVVHEE